MTPPVITTPSPAPPFQPPGLLHAGAALLVSPAMLCFATAGVLAGYYVMWNVELQPLLWLVFLCVPAAVAACRQARAGGLTSDPTMRIAALFIAWNLAVGCIRNPGAFAEYYTFEFVVGTLLLPVYLAALWMVCRNGGSPTLVRTLPWAGLAAAIAGILWWYFVQTVDEPGCRLRNPLVHGGQHPVATGLSLSMSAAATALAAATARGRNRAGLLIMLAVITLALLLTISRGALVALAAVPAVLAAFRFGETITAIVRGRSLTEALRPPPGQWSRFLPPFLTVTAVFAVFQFSAPHLAQNRDPEAPALTVLTDVPAHEYVIRGDSGRLKFYEWGLECLDSPGKWLTGAGLWVPETMLKERSGGNIDHLHSLFMATLVHGGLVGSALFLFLLGSGFARAWRMARDGRFTWLVLLACGTGGLIFDGQSACSLVTHPRFENLMFWFPVIAIAAEWRNRLGAQAGRQPSSRESR